MGSCRRYPPDHRSGNVSFLRRLPRYRTRNISRLLNLRNPHRPSVIVTSFTSLEPKTCDELSNFKFCFLRTTVCIVSIPIQRVINYKYNSWQKLNVEELMWAKPSCSHSLSEHPKNLIILKLSQNFEYPDTYMRIVGTIPSSYISVPIISTAVVLDAPIIRLQRVLGDLTAQQLQHVLNLRLYAGGGGQQTRSHFVTYFYRKVADIAAYHLFLHNWLGLWWAGPVFW